MLLDHGWDGGSKRVSNHISISFILELAFADLEQPSTSNLLILEHIVEYVVNLLSGHAIIYLAQVLFKDLDGFVIDFELGITMVQVIDMVGEWGLLAFELRDIKCFLVILCNNVNYLGDFHVAVIECTLVLLDSQLVSFTIFVNPLLDGEFLNLAIFFNNIVPNDVASSRLEPAVRPSLEIAVNSTFDGGLAEMLDKVIQGGVFERIFLEI